jgi:CDP-glucose 4,6-dehydratase
MITSSFWTGRRVFVTGHTGFKGSWLSLWLQALQCKVTGVALPPATTPALFTAARIAEGMESHFGDINEAGAVAKVMQQSAPEIIFHLAAQALVRVSYRDPLGTLMTNVLGTARVLEAARQTPSVRAIVVVTSDKCYENIETTRGYRETDPLGGHDPYSASKACADLVALMYERSFFKNLPQPVALATARAGNVIGGGDWSEDRLVPDLVRAFMQGQPALLRYPEARRPWQHVLDPLSGYLSLAEQLWHNPRLGGQGWNFAPSGQSNKTVGEVADRFAALWGGKASWITKKDQQPHEAGLLHLDATKAAEHLGWRARLGFEQALALTAEGYKAADMRQCMQKQIADFMR